MLSSANDSLQHGTMKEQENTQNILKRWWKSVQTKSTLAVLITAAALIEITAAVQYWYAREGIRKEVEHRAESELKVKDLEIEKIVNTIEAAARSTAWVIESRLDDSKDVEDALANMVRVNSNIVGCGIGFKPYYYHDKGMWFEPYALRKGDKKAECRNIGSESHDYFTAEWYTEPMRTGRGYWTEPYYDNAGGHMMLVTYTLPIRDSKGKIVAVFGTDISLDWISRLLNESHIYPSSYNLMVSRTGKLMACPVESLIMRRSLQEVTADMKDTTFRGINRQMLNGSTGQATIYDDNGEKNYVFFAPLSSDTTLAGGESTGWSMAVVCSDREIYHGLRQVGFNLMLLMLAGLALLTYIMFRSIKNMRKLQRADIEKRRIDNELAISQRIQQAMLPKQQSDTGAPLGRDDIEICASLTPAREVGGDLYDYFVRNEKLFFCIGDVAGKGVPAAMVMAMAQSAFRILAMQESSPERIVSQMNEALARDNEYNFFITLLVGVLDLPTGRLRYCNAGHKPVIMLPLAKKGDENYNVVGSALPVGAMSGWKYSAQETVIESGTTLFLYTDGLTEAENAQHGQFGTKRMQEQLLDDAEPADIIKRMTTAVHAFVGDTEQSDDLTMLAISYNHHRQKDILRRSLTLTNDVSLTPQLAEFVEAVCAEAKVGAADTMQVNLAIEEAVVNVMNYAYPRGTEGLIEIEASASTERMKFVITDNGRPFDPTTRSDADTTLSAEERSIGGLGIHLIRRYMDSMNYERLDNKNILTLRKTLNNEDNTK